MEHSDIHSTTLVQRSLEMTDTIVQAERKHLTTACTACRHRKIKCDGERPRCSYCCRLNLECFYDVWSDKRRFSGKETKQGLKARVKELEEFIRSHALQRNPDAPSGVTTTFDTVPDALRNEVNISLRPPGPQKSYSVGSNPKRTSPNCALEPYPFGNDTNVTRQAFPNSINDIEPVTGAHGNWKAPISSTLSDFKGDFSMQKFGDERDNGINQNNEDYDSFAWEVISPLDQAQNITNLSDSSSVSPSFPPMPVIQGLTTTREISLTPNNGTNSSDDDTENAISQLTKGVGALQVAEDGQLRFFGATSNLHILHSGPESLSRPHIRTIRHDGPKILKMAGIDHYVPPELEDHLIELYFAWEDPSIHVIDKEVFLDERRNWKSGIDGSSFYSEVLSNAICSIGAALTSQHDFGLPEPATDFFGARAKALLELELDSPIVATVQAVVVMSAKEAASTRDSRGWLHSGMATRLAFDLGLHLDMSSYVKAGTLTQREADVRQTTFWGVYILDKLWSLYVGRPSVINMDDITVPWPPLGDGSEDLLQWQPYIDSIDHNSPNTEPQFPNPLSAVTWCNVSLCEKINRICRTLYGNQKVDESLMRFAIDMNNELLDWHRNLLSGLKVDLHHPMRTHPPHVLQLHMQFHEVVIIVNRPFLSKYSDRLNRSGTFDSSVARQRCSESALSITRLLQAYQRQYSLRRINIQAVHIVFTAAIIHVYNAYVDKGEFEQKSRTSVNTCFQALGEMGQAYDSATRALEVIMALKRRWQTHQRYIGIGVKRSLVAGAQTGDRGETSKKIRSSKVEDNLHFAKPLPQEINLWDISSKIPWLEDDLVPQNWTGFQTGIGEL